MSTPSTENDPTPRDPRPLRPRRPPARSRSARRAPDRPGLPPDRDRGGTCGDEERSGWGTWSRYTITTDSGGGDVGACSWSRVKGTVIDKGTGVMEDVTSGCGRWRCPACGPQKLRRHMAHFRDAWSYALGSHIFLTLTLRAEDYERLFVEGQVDALRALFRRLVRRVGRAEGARPRYLAQVDAHGHRKTRHLHAVMETGLEPREMAVHWVEAGGGLDHDARRVRPTPDDLARVSGYVVKGSQWPGHGNLMVSHGLWYDSKAAVERRRAWAERTYGAERAGEVYEPAERGHGAGPRGSEEGDVVPAEAPSFESAAPVPTRVVSPFPQRGGEYAIVTTYDPGRSEIAVVAARAVKRGYRTEYEGVARVASKVHGRRFLRRYGACERRRRFRGERSPQVGIRTPRPSREEGI